MHKSSYQHMQRLVSTHLAPGSTLKVVDIGSFDVNGSYRTLFTDPGWQYTGVDLEAGPGVDVVLSSSPTFFHSLDKAGLLTELPIESRAPAWLSPHTMGLEENECHFVNKPESTTVRTVVEQYNIAESVF